MTKKKCSLRVRLFLMLRWEWPCTATWCRSVWLCVIYGPQPQVVHIMYYVQKVSTDGSSHPKKSIPLEFFLILARGRIYLIQSLRCKFALYSYGKRSWDEPNNFLYVLNLSSLLAVWSGVGGGLQRRDTWKMNEEKSQPLGVRNCKLPVASPKFLQYLSLSLYV